MSLAEHARRELELLGEDPALTDNLVQCAKLFAQFRHSGTSAELAAQHLGKLLRWEALTPLTSNPDEWEDRSELSGYPLWQSTRDPRFFSRDGGQTWHQVVSNWGEKPEGETL